MKNQQKWLTSKLKGDWIDKDKIIETTIFESLVHFVEEEKGLGVINYDWKEEIEKGDISKEEVARIKAIENLSMCHYEYITKTRPAVKKDLENIDDWKEYESVEKMLYDEDTAVMKSIIENRGYLWT